MLDLSGVVAGYGSLRALHAIDISVREGEWLAVLGAVGAGKSTLLSVMAGLVPALEGDIVFRGSSIAAAPAERRVPMGIVLVPEGRRLFAGMSVHENLMTGAYTVGDRRRVLRSLQRVFDLFPVLSERSGQIAATLSGGEQQMCAIGRALMAEPRLLLIDEVSLGLAPQIVERVFAALAEIRRGGTTLVTVEQNVSLALERADRAYLLRSGNVVISGAASALRENPSLPQLFFGY